MALAVNGSKADTHFTGRLCKIPAGAPIYFCYLGNLLFFVKPLASFLTKKRVVLH